MIDNRGLRADENQVFLMMGVSQSSQVAECAIVMAVDIEAAKLAFTSIFEGFEPMTWPSLREIRLSLDMMENARDGGFPDDVPVIDAMQSDRKGRR